MKVEIIKVGRLRCNCYILDKRGKVLIVDPGDECERIIKIIGDREVLGILITHHHFDHDGGVEGLVKRYGCMVYDKNNLLEGYRKIDNFCFEVIYTPGHKEDLIAFYFYDDKMMFCGDFIFKNSIGRCDLEGGNMKEMIDSLEKIKKYDRDIIIYPGHGEKTVLGYECDNNIYFKSDLC